MLANKDQPGFDERLYLFVRFTDKQRILVVTNFNQDVRKLQVLFPADLEVYLDMSGNMAFTDLLSGAKFGTNDISKGVEITMPPTSGLLLEF
jgi:hypothetical protein